MICIYIYIYIEWSSKPRIQLLKCHFASPARFGSLGGPRPGASGWDPKLGLLVAAVDCAIRDATIRECVGLHVGLLMVELG